MDFWLRETLLFLGVTFTLKAFAALGSSRILQHGRLPYPWTGTFHYYPLDTRFFFAHKFTLGSVCYLLFSWVKLWVTEKLWISIWKIQCSWWDQNNSNNSTCTEARLIKTQRWILFFPSSRRVVFHRGSYNALTLDQGPPLILDITSFHFG